MNTSGPYVYKYNNGFWALTMEHQQYPALQHPLWVVWMSGFGGNTVAFMPNGSTYFHFSDNDEWPPFAPVVLESPQTHTSALKFCLKSALHSNNNSRTVRVPGFERGSKTEVTDGAELVARWASRARASPDATGCGSTRP